MSATRTVSIVIPVFNKWDMTRHCLESLAAHVKPEGVEIVIVDNGSTDGTAEHCPALGASLFGPAFQYLRNEANQGFAKACNAGAAASQGRFLYFLNNDTLFTHDVLPPLLDEMANDGTGCCGPLLLYPDQTIQHMGIGFLHARKCIHIFRKFPRDHRATRRATPLQAISAAAMLVPAGLFRSLGAFHEGYVNGYEDLDLCARMREQGLRCAIRTDASMIHLESQSAGRFDSEGDNFRIYNERVGQGYDTDLDLIARANGMDLALNEWFEPYFVPGRELAASYADQVGRQGLEAAMDILDKEPCWEDGYYTIIAALRDNGLLREAFTMALDLTTFCPTLRALDTALALALQLGNAQHAKALENQRRVAAEGARQANLAHNAGVMRVWARKHGRDHLVEVLTRWTAPHDA